MVFAKKSPINHDQSSRTNSSDQRGSVELIVIGLLAALILVLAVPILQDMNEAPQVTSPKELPLEQSATNVLPAQP